MKNLKQEAGSKRKTCLPNSLSGPELGLIKLPGVLSIASKIAQEKGRVLETMLRKGDSVTILLRLLGFLNIISGNCTGGRGWPMCGKKASVTILLAKEKSLC